MTMETDNKKPLIFQKITDIMDEIVPVGKDRNNEIQKYKFRGIDDVYNAIHPLFKKHKVFMTPKVLSSAREERKTAKGGDLIFSILEVEFTFYTVDGSSVTCVMKGEGMDSGDKSSNKAMSAAQKYALIQMFAIPTEEGKALDTENSSLTTEKFDPELDTLIQSLELATDRKTIMSLVDNNPEYHQDKHFQNVVRACLKKYPKL